MLMGGTLQFAQRASLYNGAASRWTASNIVVNSGATLGLNVGGTGEFTAADLDTLLDGSHLGASTGSSGLASGSFLALDTTNAGGIFTYSNVIANPNGGANILGLVKSGAGTLILAGSNSYTGTTTVNGGILREGPRTDNLNKF